MDLGQVFAEVRTLRGLSQQEVATILQVEQSSVSRYESGATVPPKEIMKRYLQFLAFGGRKIEAHSGLSVNPKAAAIKIYKVSENELSAKVFRPLYPEKDRHGIILTQCPETYEKLVRGCTVCGYPIELKELTKNVPTKCRNCEEALNTTITREEIEKQNPMIIVLSDVIKQGVFRINNAHPLVQGIIITKNSELKWENMKVKIEETGGELLYDYE